MKKLSNFTTVIKATIWDDIDAEGSEYLEKIILIRLQIFLLVKSEIFKIKQFRGLHLEWYYSIVYYVHLARRIHSMEAGRLDAWAHPLCHK